MHGLIWEWTKNFNNSLVIGESRADSSLTNRCFAAQGQQEQLTQAIMQPLCVRYGFRSSLEAKYTVSSLGFRCASN